jgi:hypothetical protein
MSRTIEPVSLIEMGARTICEESPRIPHAIAVGRHRSEGIPAGPNIIVISCTPITRFYPVGVVAFKLVP